MNANERVLTIDRVSHSYRGTVALSNVSLELGVGATALLGPNGAGKTTLLRILATILNIQEGTVSAYEASIEHDVRKYRERLGYLPQKFGLLPQFTIREFLEYAAWLKLVPSAKRQSYVLGALDATDLQSMADRKIRDLSGGMLRRVGIAQAVVNQPSILLLDEPTVGLDPEQRSQLRVILRSLAEHMTILLATHLTEDASSICSRVIILAGGIVKFDDSIKELEELGGNRLGPDNVLERGYKCVVSHGGATSE